MEVFALFLFVVMTSWKDTVACAHYHDAACIVEDPLEGRHFLNQWIVHVEGGAKKARSIADELGFEYLKKMRTHDDHYFFRHPTGVPHRHKMKHKDVLEKLKSHEDIISSDQQYVFELTLNEMENFEDMVGHSEPLYVKFTHFNPDDELEDGGRMESVSEHAGRKMPKRKFDEESALDESQSPELNQKVDFEAEYAKRKEEIEKLDQQVDQILEKLEHLK